MQDMQDMQDMQEAHNTTGEFFVFALTNVWFKTRRIDNNSDDSIGTQLEESGLIGIAT